MNKGPLITVCNEDQSVNNAFIKWANQSVFTVP